MDPSLVRGKKLKKEVNEDDDESKEYVSDQQYVTDGQVMKTSLPELPTLPKLDTIREQENLLKYRADVLKYQGMYLHYQASVLEKEARKRHSEERRAFAFVPEIEDRKTFAYGSEVDDRKNFAFVPTIKYAADYQTATEPSYLYTPKHVDSNLPMDLTDATEYEEDEHNDEQPLDLSVKTSHSSSYLHTQSAVMPRIFFSRVSATS